jgi:hypothetical protein
MATFQSEMVGFHLFIFTIKGDTAKLSIIQSRPADVNALQLDTMNDGLERACYLGES